MPPEEGSRRSTVSWRTENRLALPGRARRSLGLEFIVRGAPFTGWAGSRERQNGEPRTVNGELILLAQRCRQSRQQRLHRLDGFITHVRDPKCFPFYLPVPTIDLESVFFPEPPGECGDIDSEVILYAGQRDRSKTFLREKLKSRRFDPIGDETVCPGMARISLLKSFRENVVEFRTQCIDVRNRRSAWGHELVGILFEFKQIEIVAPFF